MTDDKLGDRFFIIMGLILSAFADPIGRHHSKTNPRFHQKFIFCGGLFAALLGLLVLLGVL